MKNLRNSVRLIGNLGMDPEVKEVGKSGKLARFSLATNETYRNDKGEKIKETQWHQVIAWGRHAEIIEQYLKKGNEIAIEGKLTTRNYTDKEGNKRYVTEVVVQDLLMLGKKA